MCEQALVWGVCGVGRWWGGRGEEGFVELHGGWRSWLGGWVGGLVLWMWVYG